MPFPPYGPNSGMGQMPALGASVGQQLPPELLKLLLGNAAQQQQMGQQQAAQQAAPPPQQGQGGFADLVPLLLSGGMLGPLLQRILGKKGK